MTIATDTFKTRLRKYKRRESLTTWVAAGYAGIIALMQAKIFEDVAAPKELHATLTTLVVVGAALLGKARVGFEWSATKIERQIEDGPADLANALAGSDSWPSGSEKAWIASLMLMIAAGTVTIIIVWWPNLRALYLRCAGA